jgi:chemotaxis protein methyltransferase CheR
VARAEANGGGAVRRTFGSSQLASFRATVAQRLGLNFDDSKLDELAEVLQLRMKATSSPNVDSYLCLLGTSLPELRSVVGHLTIPETYFFRIPDHFRVLLEVVLPERIQMRSATRQLNILSAGCASGDEPYTVAMLLRNRMELLGWQVTIRGIDVNPAAIAKGKASRYSAWSLRETDAEFKERYFLPQGRDFQLHDSIRSMVSLEEGNLMDARAPFWKPKAYDVIFFRNAFMYLSAEAGRSVVARMAESLAPGGYLFMGPAETLRGVSSEFDLCHTHGTFYYQLRTGHGRAAKDSAHAPAPAGRASSQPAFPAEMPPVEVDGRWADSIRQATERIRILTFTPEESSKANPNPLSSAEGTPADLSIALELLQEERFEQALEALEALPAEAQSSPEVQVLRAALLANSGDLAQSERACALALEIDALNAGAYYVMALCREQADDRRTAMEHDLTAIYLDPSFAMPHLHLGLLAKRGGETDLAVQELSRASLLLPREDSPRVLLFGGGFSRDALVELCRRELQGCGGPQ